MRHEVVITRDGQAAVERTLLKLRADVQKYEEARTRAEARLQRFQQFLEAMNESERERLLGCFAELEASLEEGEEEVI